MCENSCNNQDFDPVPGGVGVNSGTSSWVVKKNGQEYLLTCGHVFNTNCENSTLKDMGVFQGSQTFGPVVDGDVDQDWAIAKIGSFEGLDPEVDGLEYSVPQRDMGFGGHYTKMGALGIASNDDQVYALGTTTCETSGTVEGIVSGNGVCGTYNDYIKTSVATKSGDSGGPVYNIVWGDNGPKLYYIHMISLSIPCSTTRGVAGYYLNNQAGLSFDP